MPGDKLPGPPRKGINQTDGPGTYKHYKYNNYNPQRKSETNSAVAEENSAVAAVKRANAEASAAARSAVPKPCPPEPPNEVLAKAMSRLGQTSEAPGYKKQYNKVRAQPGKEQTHGNGVSSAIDADGEESLARSEPSIASTNPWIYVEEKERSSDAASQTGRGSRPHSGDSWTFHDPQEFTAVAFASDTKWEQKMDHGGQKIKQCRTMAGSSNSANVESFACRPECGDTRRTTHGHGACVHAWDVVSISTYQSFRKKK